jgi:hypothetical protein
LAEQIKYINLYILKPPTSFGRQPLQGILKDNVNHKIKKNETAKIFFGYRHFDKFIFL